MWKCHQLILQTIEVKYAESFMNQTKSGISTCIYKISSYSEKSKVKLNAYVADNPSTRLTIYYHSFI